jgi:hypothetical protein
MRVQGRIEKFWGGSGKRHPGDDACPSKKSTIVIIVEVLNYKGAKRGWKMKYGGTITKNNERRQGNVVTTKQQGRFVTRKYGYFIMGTRILSSNWIQRGGGPDFDAVPILSLLFCRIRREETWLFLSIFFTSSHRHQLAGRIDSTSEHIPADRKIAT